ncbi:hypothetical protein Vi05172_g7994 [Venturia inaequalis]|nr:hypothetical protein Vi05172_g7994 [Venturia inaequalis]
MFTIVDTAIGAFLLHQATKDLYFNHDGSILGVGGMLRTLRHRKDPVIACFFVGMALSYGAMRLIAPEVLPKYPNMNWDLGTILFALITSILVGWGTKCCGGCTSKHILCGLPRLSPPSIVATIIFFTTAVATFKLLNPSLITSACLSNTPCYLSTPSLVLKSKPLCLLIFLSALAIERLSRLHNPRASTLVFSRRASRTTYLLCGYTSGLGLLVSGMASPAKVSAFFAFSLFPLDFTKWDPSLLMIILCGTLPNMARLRWSRYPFATITLRGITWRFVLGAAAFGIGWGASGICFGTAILRAVAQPTWGLLWLVGFWLGDLA